MVFCALAVAVAVAGVPPLPPFPSEVRPKDGSTAPKNAKLVLLGDPAPAPQTVGIAVTFDGAAAAVDHVDGLGCCALVATLASEPAEGQVVAVNVTAPTGDVAFSYTAGAADSTPPSLTQNPLIVDDTAVDGNREQLVIGVRASDDTQIGFVEALVDGTVTGVSADGFLLTALAPVVEEQACVDIVVVDVAGNLAAAAQPTCLAVGGEGEGEGGGGGAECEGPGDVPVHVPSTAVVLVLLGVLFAVRRAR